MGRMVKSVNFLVTKYRRRRREEVPDTWRDVKVSDRVLEEDLHLPPHFLGEGVQQVSKEAKQMLQLPPKTATYSKIKIEDIEVEITKVLEVKARWELKERQEMAERTEERADGNQKTRQEEEEEASQETQVHDKQKRILRLHKTRVTDLPTNKEVFLPEERPKSEESGLRAFKALV